MSPYWYPGVFLLAAGLTAILTPLVIRLGQRWNLVAEPGGRRLHHGRITRIGGLALYPPFAIACLVTLGVTRSDPLEVTRMVGMLVGTTIVFGMGMLDDRYRLS